MPVDSGGRPTAAQAPGQSEQALLLVRAPSDREIYGAFRALAGRWRDREIGEQLLIEGDVPLTADLAAPAMPATLQRLLDADCEMIDVLAIEAHPIRVTYLRSGGHAPFRESFYDELRVEVHEDAAASAGELESIFTTLFSHLGVVSHSASSPFATIIAGVLAKYSGSDDEADDDATSPPAHFS